MTLPKMQDRTAMHRRAVQILLALLTVFVLTAFSTPEGVGAQSIDSTGTIETLIVSAAAAGPGNPACPCPEDQTQQACGKGPCPTGLVLDASQPATARDSTTYEILQKRHKTSPPKTEHEPPRPSV